MIRFICMIVVSLVVGCAAAREPGLRADLDHHELTLAAFDRGDFNTTPPGSTATASTAQDLAGYLAHAAASSPALRASFERWRAAVHRISSSRRLPEPVLSYGYFIRSVETRVGPQRHRLGLQQSFPWPTRLTEGANAAAAQARALQRRFDADLLALRRQVSEAYYDLWLHRRIAVIQRQQLELLRGLSAATRARVATGGTTLADQQQVDLALARLDDRVRAHDEAARAVEARLRAVIGASGQQDLGTPDGPPEPALPDETDAAMRRAVLLHPMLDSLLLLGEASEAAAHREEAARFPGLVVGLDWIEVGEAGNPSVPDSGKDALVIGLGLKLPLWQPSYVDSVTAEQAEAAARRAEARAAGDHALAEFEALVSTLRDAERRARLHRTTLLPQALGAYESVMGGYATGRSSVSAAILAQRELLEISIGLEQARTDHAVAWSRLEQVVGHEVSRASVPPVNHAKEPDHE